jgi:hypothetical protein
MVKKYGLLIVLALLLSRAATAAAPTTDMPTGWVAQGFEPVGYTDVDGRPAFKLAIKQKAGRWYLFATHIFHSGLTVLDVTDPSAPRPIRLLPQAPHTFTLQVDLANDLMITSLEQNFLDPAAKGKPYDEGVILWNIEDPANPQRLGQFKTGGTGTHRNFFSGGRYMHLAAGMPGYSGNIYVIVDISDPRSPREAGRWWVKGQHIAGGERIVAGADSDSTPPQESLCGADADVSLHGPPYIVANKAYLPYGSAGLVILDISDVKRPRQIGRLDFSPPFNSKLEFTARCRSRRSNLRI